MRKNPQFYGGSTNCRKDLKTVDFSYSKIQSEGYLSGQFLLAMPNMSDMRFAKTVIFLCAHSQEGAMGIVINRRIPKFSFADLLLQIGLGAPEEDIKLDQNQSSMSVMFGGPVETQRGFVLHSGDYFLNASSVHVSEQICLTASIEILKDMAEGKGPKSTLLALGYAGWSAGQLEEEIKSNGWLNCPCDPDLMFSSDHTCKYESTLEHMGIDPRLLSSTGGTA